ncbi:MAG: di-trans,poly-cis-decaprenylcistransferase [Candidatus Lokiarchaeota archaeon]|nr:di-trans,poly-cis-decaprenylcistransferase [Candidatus Lokiarchaeota archaeon]
MEKLLEFDGDRLPLHVGLIPDGNRRWARINNVDTKIGHLSGYEALRKIIFSFFDYGITYLSIYCLSIENVKKRSEIELKYLYKIIQKACETIKNEPLVVKEEVKVNVFGRTHLLPDFVQESLQDLMDFTKDYNKNFLNLLIMYDGQEEIVDCMKQMIANNVDPRDITPKTIKQFLYSCELPELDYIIRTGMDDGARISGFLLWDASYAEFKFRNDYWPDYNEEMLVEDLKDYIQRHRRKGK